MTSDTQNNKPLDSASLAQEQIIMSQPAPIAKTKRQRRKRCDACGELKLDVVEGLCEECEQDYYVQCRYCGRRRADEMCHHLWGWEDIVYGVGALRLLNPSNVEDDWETYHKESFQEFITEIADKRLIQDFIEAIQTGQYSFDVKGNILFGHTAVHFEILGINYWYCNISKYDDKTEYERRRAIEGKLEKTVWEEAYKPGLAWLLSLRPGEIAAAEKLTIQWLENVMGEPLLTAQKN